jgi:hypothetical protein
VTVETYGTVSESVVNVGNAADRLSASERLATFCTASKENADTKMCGVFGADRAPSDSPKERYNRNAAAAVSRGGHYYHRPYDADWYRFWYAP